MAGLPLFALASIDNSYHGGQERGLRNALGLNIVNSPDMNLKSVIIDGIKRCLYNALKEAAAPAASHYQKANSRN
jgi:hypothetical protein